MRGYLYLFFVLFSGSISAQQLLVMDEEGTALPFYTVNIENEKRVLVGGEDGRISLDGVAGKFDCGFTIRYLGYRAFQFCRNDLKKGENKIILQAGALDLPETDIVGLSDKELILNAKSYFARMVDRFSVVRAFVLEKSDQSVWESLGVVTLSGLSDRTKNYKWFEFGNLSFLPQYSRLWTTSDTIDPYRTNFAIAAVFSQDLLLGILQSKTKDWSQANTTDLSTEHFRLENHHIILSLNPDGIPRKITIEARDFKAPTGRIYTLSGELNFIQDPETEFFSELTFNVHEKYPIKAENPVSVSCIIHGFPTEIILPKEYRKRSVREKWIVDFGNYSHVPDYTFVPALFNKIVESNFNGYKTTGITGMRLVTKDYTQAELFDHDDPPSLEYVKTNSEFIRSLLTSLKAYDITW